ncbi:MAG: hypothetical protein IMZ65_03960 [Planctomycetes bacterium]|nr:hypothetical protein [Planctomycetota bacterium]
MNPGGVSLEMEFREEVLGQFFNLQRIRALIGPVMANALSRFGAYVMSDARRSIREIGPMGKPAPGGSPPRSRTGLLKENILFGLAADGQSVVIGPAKLSGKIGDAPRALEFGGVSQRRFWRRTRGPSFGRPEGTPGGLTTEPVDILPHPYMRPAFERNLGKWPQILAQAQAAGPTANWAGTSYGSQGGHARVRDYASGRGGYASGGGYR